MPWIPRPAHDAFDDTVWLPRMIEKARRHADGIARDADLMNGYLYGDNDYIDALVLRFLRIDARALSALVAQYPDDGDVARIVVERSGRSPAQRRAFSAGLTRRLFDFVMLDADEGRIPRGVRRSVVTFVYNRIMMPILYAAFRRAERKTVTR